jgi:hypothetical protein
VGSVGKAILLGAKNYSKMERIIDHISKINKNQRYIKKEKGDSSLLKNTKL